MSLDDLLTPSSGDLREYSTRGFRFTFSRDYGYFGEIREPSGYFLRFLLDPDKDPVEDFEKIILTRLPYLRSEFYPPPRSFWERLCGEECFL